MDPTERGVERAKQRDVEAGVMQVVTEKRGRRERERERERERGKEICWIREGGTEEDTRRRVIEL